MQLLAALEVVVKSLLFTLSPIQNYCLALECIRETQNKQREKER